MSTKIRLAGKLMGAACVLSFAAATTVPVRAQTVDALLDLLKAKGEISQAEYNSLKAQAQNEAKGTEAKLRAAEAKARAADARAREAEANARQANMPPQSLLPVQASAAPQATVPGGAIAVPALLNRSQGTGTAVAAAPAGAPATSEAAAEAAVRSQTLTAADMAVPPMAAKSPVAYVTVLPNCVGIRVGEVDICTKGDIDFFGIEQFPDRSKTVPQIQGGVVSVAQTAANSIRGGLLPSELGFNITTHQMGLDIGVGFGMYVGGNNVDPVGANANGAGHPFALGTPGIDFRQVYGTIGTPTAGTIKAGRDLGLFGSDAILNDLTLLGVGTAPGNWAPGNTTLGRIGVGYVYADWLPQFSYKSPTVNGFTVSGGAFQPLDEIDAFGDVAGNMTAHDVPMLQGQLKYVNSINANTKVTLSTDGLWQRHVCDFTEPADGVPSVCSSQGQSTDAWGWDGFGMLDVMGWNLVAYGYEGRGLGTTGLFFDGVDVFGNARKSYGGYGQASYTFNGVFTVGGSWGISYLNTANALDNAANPLLVHSNQSWVGFARYKLTKWVNLQAEYTHSRAVDQAGDVNQDNTIAVGTTFFW